MINNRTIIEYTLVSLAISLAWKAYNSQTLNAFLNLGLYLAIAFIICYGAYLVWNKQLTSRPRQGASTAEKLRHFLFACNLCISFGLIAYTYMISFATQQITHTQYRLYLTLAVFSTLAAWGILMLSRHRPSRNSIQMVALIISITLSAEVWKVHSEPAPAETLILGPVFNEPFYTWNGGNSRLINTSLARKPARYIYAFTVTDQKFATSDHTTSEQRVSLSFGKPVLAPISGTVYEVVSDRPDRNENRSFNHPLGNYITLKLKHGRYVLLTNLKQDSVTVSTGDQVDAGQIIGAVGWSGLVSESMLAMLVIDSPDIFSPSTLSFPFYFKDVKKLGDATDRKLHFPRRNDIFIPLPVQR